MISFDLTILGTSSALPTSQRYQTAQVLNIRERFFLIDCGEGTQIQLRKYGMKFPRINHIFISHLHGDHFFGLIGLLTTYALLNRKNDLHIYAHSELQEILQPQIDYLSGELNYRIVWHPLNFKKPQVILENEAVKVTSFPVEHRIPCCGFLFEEQAFDLNIRKEKLAEYKVPVKDIYKIKKGEDFIAEDGSVIPNYEITLPAFRQRKYAFVTDTRYLPKLAEIIEGVDILYHEATFDKSLKERASKTFHTTSDQAAQLASSARVKQLMLGHFSARYKDIGFLLEEAKEIFPDTIAAEEGMTIRIPQERISEG